MPIVDRTKEYKKSHPGSSVHAVHDVIRAKSDALKKKRHPAILSARGRKAMKEMNERRTISSDYS